MSLEVLISQILTSDSSATPRPAMNEEFPPLGRRIRVLMVWQSQSMNRRPADVRRIMPCAQGSLWGGATVTLFR